MKKRIKKRYVLLIASITLCVVVAVPWIWSSAASGFSGDVNDSGVTYRLIGDSYYIVSANKAEVTVKNKINNVPVAGTLKQAFKDNAVTKKLTFSGVFESFSFDDNTFDGSAIESIINIPSSASFSLLSFRNMPKIADIQGESSGITYVKNGILYSVAGGIVSLIKVPTNLNKLPADYAKNVDVIFTGAFDYSTLGSVDLPKTLRRVESFAFYKSEIRTFILRDKSIILPRDAISPLKKDIEILVDAKDQASFKDYLSGGANFLQIYRLYMHPLNEGYNSGHGKIVHCAGSFVSITGYTYTVNADRRTINVTLSANQKLLNVDAWYILNDEE